MCSRKWGGGVLSPSLFSLPPHLFSPSSSTGFGVLIVGSCKVTACNLSDVLYLQGGHDVCGGGG
ncbi:unnamed protein product [Prunus armeniaca]